MNWKNNKKGDKMGKRNEERVNTRSYERKKNLRKRKPIACKVKEPEK